MAKTTTTLDSSPPKPVKKPQRHTTRAKGLISANSTPQKSKEWYPKFLEALAEYGVISYACQVARIDRQTYYNRINSDIHFAEQVEAAKEEAADGLEKAAFDRAKNGTKSIILDRDGCEHEITNHHDTLAIFLLKGLKPTKYAKPEVLVQNNTQNNVTINHMTRDEWERRLAERGGALK